MIRSMRVENFSSVPYLESSAIVKNNPEGFFFSTEKPTVIVGPNGSGKSALMRTLALRFLAEVLGESSFDREYVDTYKPYWTNSSRWGHEWEFLKGLTCDTDNSPAVYYRPGHVPGNEASATHALCMDLADEARAYVSLVDKKSSGEGHKNRLERVLSILRKETSLQYRYARWKFGQEPRDLSDHTRWSGATEHKAEVLKALFSSPGQQPLVLMDEPEQSLDALSELQLWKELSKEGNAQLIVASHSLYPLQHPELFWFIETTPGYINAVRELT